MDIVEVARDPKNLCQVQGCNTAPICLCGLIEDMADEIERLREALRKISNSKTCECQIECVEMWTIAYTALKEKEDV